jgi:hypothetical protein
MYNNLVFGKELCIVPEYILEFLKHKLETCIHHAKPNLIADGYRQWNLHNELVSEERAEIITDWVSADCEILDDFFKDYVKKLFRFRLSVLEPNEKIGWHKTHRYPRIHIPLNSSNSEFVIKNFSGNKQETIPMYYGKAYLINVTFPHAVNTVESVRHNAFFCFDSFATEEIAKNFMPM